jgi:hypothetical protein
VNPQDDPTAVSSDNEPGLPRPLWGPPGTSGVRPTTVRNPTGPAPADPAVAAPIYPPPPTDPPPPGFAPIERPHPAPPARSTTAGSSRRTGLVIGLAVAAGLILTTVVVIVQQIWTPSTTTTRALPPTNSNNGGLTTTPSPTPPPAIGTNLVHVTSTAASHPSAAAVAELLDRHFTAINQYDYASWSTTVVSQRANDQSAAAWLKGYRSTNDDSVVVTSIFDGSTGLTVALSFRSTQQPSDAPPDLPVARICWESQWPVVDISNGGRIGTPAKGTTTKRAC